ncbi:MAG: hypothetical protein ACRDUY_09600 [Nitriliruptorales bacterium]
MKADPAWLPPWDRGVEALLAEVLAADEGAHPAVLRVVGDDRALVGVGGQLLLQGGLGERLKPPVHLGGHVEIEEDVASVAELGGELAAHGVEVVGVGSELDRTVDVRLRQPRLDELRLLGGVEPAARLHAVERVDPPRVRIPAVLLRVEAGRGGDHPGEVAASFTLSSRAGFSK